MRGPEIGAGAGTETGSGSTSGTGTGVGVGDSAHGDAETGGGGVVGVCPRIADGEQRGSRPLPGTQLPRKAHRGHYTLAAVSWVGKHRLRSRQCAV